MGKKLRKITEVSDPPPAACPKCASGRTAPIRYGKVTPTRKVREDIMQERYILGGDVLCPDDPTWHCFACGDKGGRRHYFQDGKELVQSGLNELAQIEQEVRQRRRAELSSRIEAARKKAIRMGLASPDSVDDILYNLSLDEFRRHFSEFRVSRAFFKNGNTA
jgi:hypothetical protein